MLRLLEADGLTGNGANGGGTGGQSFINGGVGGTGSGTTMTAGGIFPPGNGGFGGGAGANNNNPDGFFRGGGGGGFSGGQGGTYSPTTVTNSGGGGGGSFFTGPGGHAIAGNGNMPSQDGNSTMNGNTGNGFIRVTLIEGVFNPVNIEVELIGASTITIPQGTAFTDPGARVLKNGVEASIIMGTGTVNTNVIGTYTLTYTYSGVTTTRTINVVAPSVTNFNFTGNVQTFTAPEAGTYRLEIWGASRRTRKQ